MNVYLILKDGEYVERKTDEEINTFTDAFREFKADLIWHSDLIIDVNKAKVIFDKSKRW